MFPMVANSNCRGFFLLRWILLLPLSLKVFQNFILYLMVRFVVVVNYLLNKNVVSVNLPAHIPGKCQSLREIFKEADCLKTWFKRDGYGTCHLYKRVLLAIGAIFYSSSTLEQITLMTPIVILIDLPNFMSRSCKLEIYIVHWMEVFSTLVFFFSSICFYAFNTFPTLTISIL